MFSFASGFQSPEQAAPENQVAQELVGPGQASRSPSHTDLQTGEQEHEKKKEAEKKIFPFSGQPGQFLQ